MSDIERLSVAVDPYLDDFDEVLRVLELSSGFVLLPIAVPGPDLAQLLANWLALKTHPTIVYAPSDDGEWKSVAEWLLKAKPEKNGVVLVIGGGDLPDDLSLALRLVNERRDSIAKHLDCPLLWCGSSEFLVQTGHQAPDFWSARAVERRIEARKKSESKKAFRKKAHSKDELLHEALRQGDRKSSEILFLSHMRKAMADADNGDFDAIVASIPSEIEQADPKFCFEVELMKAEMARRRGNIVDALEILDALEEKVASLDDECRVNLLRGRIFEKVGDTKRVEKAYEKARVLPEQNNYNWQMLYVLYAKAFHARTSSEDWTSRLRKSGHLIQSGKDRPLHALAMTFLAEATARQHDLARAQRLLVKAIALHEESKDDATILFGGEVAEAIQRAKSVIEHANERISVDKNVPHNVSRKREYVAFALAIFFALAAAVTMIYEFTKFTARPKSMHCFQNPAGEITCGDSLEHCEKLRAATGAASSGPCQKPLFAPSDK